MNIQELHKQIINKQLNNIYIFTGDEIAIQKIYINKIASIQNIEVQYVDNFKSIHNKLHQTDIFNTKKLYVVIDDYDYIKEEKAWAIDNFTDMNGNIIIFKFNNLDKRSKYYKYFENNIVEFAKLSDDMLIQYIHKELPSLYNENCLKLIRSCDNSYNQILLEIDKIKQIENKCKDSYSKTNNIFDDLDIHGAFHKEISDITFEFVEKVLKRDIGKVFKLQQQLEQIGESNIKLLSLLYTNFKIILQIQSCKSNDICKTTGLQYYQVKYNQDKLNYYSIGELVSILKTIQRIEEGIKTGVIDELISIDYLLVSIL